MIDIELLFTLEHPYDSTLGYAVYQAGDQTFWYRVDYECGEWEHIPAVVLA